MTKGEERFNMRSDLQQEMGWVSVTEALAPLPTPGGWQSVWPGRSSAQTPLSLVTAGRS